MWGHKEGSHAWLDGGEAGTLRNAQRLPRSPTTHKGCTCTAQSTTILTPAPSPCCAHAPALLRQWEAQLPLLLWRLHNHDEVF